MNWLLTRNLLGKKIWSIRVHFVQTNCVFLLLLYRFINVLITNKIGTQVTIGIWWYYFSLFSSNDFRYYFVQLPQNDTWNGEKLLLKNAYFFQFFLVPCLFPELFVKVGCWESLSLLELSSSFELSWLSRCCFQMAWTSCTKGTTEKMWNKSHFSRQNKRKFFFQCLF